MKALIIILAGMMLYVSSQAQTTLRPKPLSAWQIGSNTINFSDTSVFAPREQQSFILGWQWVGPNLATNERLRCNFYHDNFGIGSRQRYYPSLPRLGSLNYVVQAGLQIGGDTVHYLGGRGLQFDPVAPDSLDARLPLLPHDTTGAVFGFSFRNFGVLSAFPSADFNRYNLTTDSILHW